MSSASQSPELEAYQLVASFLRSHQLHSTLTALLKEAPPRIAQQLEHSTSIGTGHNLTDVVEDLISARLSRAKLENSTTPLLDQLNALKVQTVPDKVRTAVRESSNVLTVKRGVLPKRSWDSAELRFRSEEVPCIFTTAVDRTLKVFSTSTFDLLDTFSLPSPALAFAQHPQPEHSRFVACATMEGSLTVIDLVTREVVAKVKDHNKYIVSLAWSPDGRYLTTLGYDKLVHVYSFTLSLTASPDAPALLDDETPDPLALVPTVSLTLAHTFATRTNPEAAVWLPDSRWMVWSAREDHLLHYLGAPSGDEKEWTTESYNLNENGDAFVSFSILALTLHPVLPLLSLQTSTTNARILLYPFHSTTRLLTLHTSASQSDYFNPRHAWLPSGAACVVNSEDGIVRVVALNGKVVVAKGAHGPAAPLEDAEGMSDALRSERARARREADKGSSVVRDVEVLPLEGAAADEVRIVSCGFDKTVKVLERV